MLNSILARLCRLAQQETLSSEELALQESLIANANEILDSAQQSRYTQWLEDSRWFAKR
jgi:hypothetical protein